ncbi:MAG TPA: beta-propeller fold lactonase family protein [Mobilitalea sp.]|nr:beta-propeller fold lactonase family protein [Mobilitalea sp.]
MELIISGYGRQLSDTLALYTFYGNKSDCKWQASIDDASFVCSGDGYLFTVTEAETYAVVYLFQQSATGYELLDQKQIEGGALCHITYSPVNKALFGACYGTGTLFSVRVEEGKLGEVLFHEVQTKEEQNALTRAHCVLLNQSETVLAAVNIALDRIFIYQIKAGYLSPSGYIDLPEGAGPRHMIYSREESLIYIITEYSNEIFIYKNNGKYELLQKISTLAPDFTGSSNCSTLCFSQDGSYLYAANRGADTIAVFAVREDGTLQWRGEQDCGGKHPRHMIISMDNSNLIVCNQLSNQVVIFELDQQSGGLLRKAGTIPFSAPSGILELI